jgi:hypothetical protein
MRLIIQVLLGLSVVSLSACEQAGYIEKAKYDKLEQQNAELKKQLAQKDEEIRKAPHHHYSLHIEGFRTFRFDSDTGQTCIQLTTPADWKQKETKLQSCNCQDLFVDGTLPDENIRELECD